MTDNAKETHAYRSYVAVRDAVMVIKAREAEGGADVLPPSAYWREELENFDYMYEATPRIIAKLRHHTYHTTGLKTYDYRSNQVNKLRLFEARYRALVDLAGTDLLVPEARLLGGFGYEIDGRLLNLDTLKFFEVLVGMDRAGALSPFREAGPRRFVWEIGAGWGGFPYQFKSLFPDVTYVVTDFADLFLFSVTYLAAVFPAARWLVYRGDQDRGALERWSDYDFVFLPTAFPGVLPPAPPALVVNMVSFQEMTSEQVRAYADRVARLGADVLYSLNRDRSPYNAELTNVRHILGEYFAVEEIPLLESDYTSAVSGGSQKPRTSVPPDDGKEHLGYRHVVARRPMPDPAVDAGRAAKSEVSKADDVRMADRPQPHRAARAAINPLQVRVGLGMPLYNNARYLGEAIQAICAQTYRDFGVVMLDDHSSDKTETLARRWVRRDGRFHYVRSKRRLGMVAAWRRVFHLTCKTFPNIEYFAWVSDHDRWGPAWLETMVAELDRNPDVVLAYSYTKRMSAHGVPASVREPAYFETVGMADLASRWEHTCRSLIGAGNMVYGLIRRPALERAGVFRNVLLPDRLLAVELSLQGQIRQVPRVLWYRRELTPSSIRRQRSTLFGPGRRPLRIYLPWWFVHAVSLVRYYADQDVGGVHLTRGRGRRMARQYAVAQVRLTMRKARLQAERNWFGFKTSRDRVVLACRHAFSRVRMAPWRLTKRLAKSWRRLGKRVGHARNRFLRGMLAPALVEPITKELARSLNTHTQSVTNLRDQVKALDTKTSRAETHVADLQREVRDLRHHELADLGQGVARNQRAIKVVIDRLFELKLIRYREAFGSLGAALMNDEAFQKLARPVIETQRTLLGHNRLYALWQAVRNVAPLGLPAAEVGCYRGGASFFVAGAFRQLLGREIEYHAFDTFEGHLASGITQHDTVHKPGMFGDARFEDVQNYLSAFGRLTVHRGDVAESVKQLSECRWGLVHIDTDLYSGTLSALEYFAPRLATGGVIVIDDYDALKCPGVRVAVEEYLRDRSGFSAWQLPTEQLLLVKLEETSTDLDGTRVTEVGK